MALVIEITTADGAVNRVSLADAQGKLAAQAGAIYQLIAPDADGPAGQNFSGRIHRADNDLIVLDLPNGESLTITGFFSVCGAGESSCALQLAPLGGESWESITPGSEPIAALSTGDFLLWASPTLDTAMPVAPETEFNWKPYAGAAAGLAVVAGAGGGSGGDSAVGSDQTPDRPEIQTQLVALRFPVISGIAPPDAVVTLVIDLGGTGTSVSYRVTADSNGNWSVDTAAASPLVGTMPDDGLPVDAPSPVAAIAATSAGNSQVANGLLEIDSVAPIVTASLGAIRSDASAPAGDTETDIAPGNLSDGDATNDTSPLLTGTISGPLAPGDALVIVRNGQIVGQAQVTGLNWTFQDSDLPTGEHVYFAQVTDAAGNSSAASTSIRLAVDGLAPAVPTIDPIADDNVVTLLEAQSGIVISGAAEAGAQVRVQIGAVTQTTISDPNGVYSVNFGVSQLPGNGSLAVRVNATDNFGNVSESTERQINIATGLPAAPVIDVDSISLGGEIPAIDANESASGFSITGTADPGNAIVVSFRPTNGGEAITAEGVVDSVGRFAVSFAPGALADGRYELQAQIADFAGQVVEGPVVAVLVDSSVPVQVATITGATDSEEAVTGVLNSGALTNDATPQLNGRLSSALGADDSVQITLNGQPIGTAQVNGLDWQFTGPALPEGPNNWTARVVDAAGNAGPVSAAFELNLDLTAPAAATINVLAGNDIITAAEAANGIVVSGRGPANEVVSLNWAGQLREVNVDAAGNWSTTYTSAPAEGLTQITAIVSDVAGNTAEAFRTVTVDSQPPGAPGIGMIAANDIVNAEQAVGGVTIAGTGESGSTIAVQWGNLTATTTVSSAGFWTTRFDGVPGQGQTIVQATASDAGGNVSPTTERIVTVDTVAPAAPQLQPVEQDNIIDASEAGDGIPVSGLAQAAATVIVRWAGQEQRTTAGADGLFLVNFETVPAEGESAITAIAVDPAGNSSEASQLAVIVNTTLPPPPPQIDAIAIDNQVNAAEAAGGINITGTGQAGAGLSVNWGAANRTTAVDANGNWAVNFDAAALPADGNSVVSVVASNAGGTSTVTTRTVVVDTTAPLAPTIDAVTGDNTVDAADALNGVSLQGSAQAGSTIQIQWENLSRTTTADNAGRWQVSFSSLPADGDTSVRVTATDALGNTSVATTAAVTVNTVAPPESPQIAAVATDNIINSAEANSGVRVSGSSAPGSAINLTWGNASGQTTATASGSWTLLITAADLPADGDSIIEVTATNAGGTSTAANQAVVIDRAPPPAPAINAVTGDNLIDATEASNPISISGTAAAGSAIEVSWGDASAQTTAAANGNWSVTYTSLPVDEGNSTLSAVATDNAGNTSPVASAEITVNSIEPPDAPTIDSITDDNIVNAIEASTNVIVGGRSTPGTDITVTWETATRTGTTNPAGNWSVAFGPTVLPADGDSTIIVVASNAGGNSTAATRSVTVDRIAPAAPVIDVIAGDDVIDATQAGQPIVISGTSAAGAAVTVVWGTANLDTNADANGLWQVSFANLPVTDGASDVSVVASDVAGNESAPATRTVTVNTIAPPAPPEILDVAGDNVVNAAEAGEIIVVSGTAEPGADVSVQWGAATGQTSAASDGGWQIDFSAGSIPPDGDSNIIAIASNAGGSSTAASLEVTVDTASPTEPVIAPVTGDNSIDVAEAGATIVVSGTAEADSVINLVWGSETQTVTVGVDGAWSASFAGLPPGDATQMSANATDLAGNVSPATVNPLTIAEPAVAPAAPLINIVSDDDLINIVDASGAVRISGSADPGATVTLTWGSITLTPPVDVDGNWTNTFDATEIPADGLSIVTAVATANGLDSEPTTREVQIDTTPPAQQVSIADLIDDSGPIDMSIANGGSTIDTSPTVVLDLDLVLDTGDTLVLYDNGDPLLTLGGDAETTFELAELAPGAYSLTAQVYDVAQNPGLLSDPFTFVVNPAP
ncbi:MAG: Ig-like domain-containing protein [Burkholderiaceae bacterium]